MLKKLVIGFLIISMLIIPACNKDHRNDDRKKVDKFLDNYDEDARSDIEPRNPMQ